MIRIAHPHIETPIFLTARAPVVLTCENPEEYYKFVTESISAFNGEESDFSFWQEEKQIKPDDKGEMLFNNFSFDLGDKKIVNLLYKKLIKNFNNENFLQGLNELNACGEKFLLNLTETVDIPVCYDELSLESFFKAVNLKPAKDYENLLEKFISLINVFTELKRAEFFVFVGLKDILSVKQLQSFYYHCNLKQVGLLLLESNKRQTLQNEKVIIITEDLCEIVENF